MKGKGLLKLKLKVDGMEKCLIKTISAEYDRFIAEDIVRKCDTYKDIYREVEEDQNMNKGVREGVKAIAQRYFELKNRLDKYKEYELIDKKDIAEQVENYLESKNKKVN